MAQVESGWGSYCFLEMLKNPGLQRSTLSDPHTTTGFGPFELPTHGLLQKGGLDWWTGLVDSDTKKLKITF